MKLSEYKLRNKGFLILKEYEKLSHPFYEICITKEDYERYGFKGTPMFSDDTYIIRLPKEEFLNWQRTKLMDRMLDEK